MQLRHLPSSPPIRLSHPDQLGIPLSLEAETNKYFPSSNSAAQVRDALVAACRQRGVAVRFGAAIAGLRPAEGGWWVVELEGGEELAAERVVSFEELAASG